MDIEDVVSNITKLCKKDNKKILEFKLGKLISENIFETSLESKYINNYLNLIPKNFPVKYFYNTVYCYKNMQLIVDKKGIQKCYEDFGEIEKIDIKYENSPVRILLKNRKKIDNSNFDCLKNYDSIMNRELISISLKENLKINIYNKKYQNNPKNFYEITGQFLYNKNNIKNLEKDIKILFKHLLIYQNVQNIETYF